MTKFIVFFLKLIPIAIWALAFNYVAVRYSPASAGLILFVNSIANVLSTFSRGGQNVIALKAISSNRFTETNFAFQELYIFAISIFSSLAMLLLTALFGKHISIGLIVLVPMFALQGYYSDLLRAQKKYFYSLFASGCITSILFLLFLFLPFIHSDCLTLFVISYAISCVLLRLSVSSFFPRGFECYCRDALDCTNIRVTDLKEGLLVGISRMSNLGAGEITLIAIGMVGMYDLSYLIGMSQRVSLVIGISLIAAQTYSEPIFAKLSLSDSLQYLHAIMVKLTLFSFFCSFALLGFFPLIQKYLFSGYPPGLSFQILIISLAAQVLNTSFGPLIIVLNVHSLNVYSLFGNILSIVLSFTLFILLMPVSVILAVSSSLILSYALKNAFSYASLRYSISCTP